MGIGHHSDLITAPIFAISRLRMGTDGQGVTTLVAFMGCPLKCKYCLNRQCHKEIYEDDATTPREGIAILTPQELYDLVKKDNIYFQATGGGICFGGGEPTMYEKFIIEFKRLCGDKWKITFETCLKCSNKTIQELSNVVDHWIVDIKSWNPHIYERYTKVSSDVDQNLETLSKYVPVEKVTIKVPRIPGFNDEANLDEDIKKIKQRYGFINVVESKYIKL